MSTLLGGPCRVMLSMHFWETTERLRDDNNPGLLLLLLYSCWFVPLRAAYNKQCV